MLHAMVTCTAQLCFQGQRQEPPPPCPWRGQCRIAHLGPQNGVSSAARRLCPPGSFPALSHHSCVPATQTHTQTSRDAHAYRSNVTGTNPHIHARMCTHMLAHTHVCVDIASVSVDNSLPLDSAKLKLGSKCTLTCSQGSQSLDLGGRLLHSM